MIYRLRHFNDRIPAKTKNISLIRYSKTNVPIYDNINVQQDYTIYDTEKKVGISIYLCQNDPCLINCGIDS